MVQKSLSQLWMYTHFINGANLVYNVPLVRYHLAHKLWSFMNKGISKEEQRDMNETKTKLEKYYHLYNYMIYCYAISDLAIGVHKNFQCNAKYLASSIWRQSSETTYPKVVEKYTDLLEIYYNLLDQSTDVWKAKIEKEIGYLVSFLYSYLELDTIQSLKETSPSFKRFENDKHKFFR